MTTMPAMPRRRTKWRVASALLAMCVLGVESSHAQPTAAGVCDAAIQKAPLEYTLTDLDGNAVNLASYGANVIAVSFWATSCLPCRVEVRDSSSFKISTKRRVSPWWASRWTQISRKCATTLGGWGSIIRYS